MRLEIHFFLVVSIEYIFMWLVSQEFTLSFWVAKKVQKSFMKGNQHERVSNQNKLVR